MNQTQFIDLKILVPGNYETGKTAYCRRYTYNTFKKEPIEAEFFFKFLNRVDGCYRIQIWDIRRCYEKKLTGIISKDAFGVVILCNNPSEEEFANITKVKQEIESAQKFVDGRNIPFLLIQSHIDLLTEKDNYIGIELRQFAEENGFINFFQVSSKTGIGVHDSMDFLITTIIDRMQRFNNMKVMKLNRYKKYVNNQCIE